MGTPWVLKALSCTIQVLNAFFFVSFGDAYDVSFVTDHILLLESFQCCLRPAFHTGDACLAERLN